MQKKCRRIWTTTKIKSCPCKICSAANESHMGHLWSSHEGVWTQNHDNDSWQSEEQKVPSDLDYKDQALSLQELRRGDRISRKLVTRGSWDTNNNDVEEQVPSSIDYKWRRRYPTQGFHQPRQTATTKHELSMRTLRRQC